MYRSVDLVIFIEGAFLLRVNVGFQITDYRM